MGDRKWFSYIMRLLQNQPKKSTFPTISSYDTHTVLNCLLYLIQLIHGEMRDHPDPHNNDEMLQTYLA